MPRKLVALLFAIGATLVAAPAAQALTHAMVSYRTSTGLDVEDQDNQNNDLRLSFAPRTTNDSVNLVITEVAKDPRTNNPFGALEPGAGCAMFNGNDQQVHCVIPASGSKQIIVNLGGGDDSINWTLSSLDNPSGFFDDAVLHISGGAGDDFIRIVQQSTATATGSDWFGGDGNDELRYVGNAPQRINGGNGDDMVVGDAGDDNLNGGAGNDVVEGAQGSDTLDGGAGNDRLLSHGGSFDQGVVETIHDDGGNDTLDLSEENNSLGAPLGGHAEISLDGVKNDRWVITGPADAGGVGTVHTYDIAGIENIIGTNANGFNPPRDGADILTGNDGANVIDGAGGNDTIRGAAPGASSALLTSIQLGPLPPPPVIVPNLLVVQPRDTLLGNAGDDTITGSANADTIDGGLGQDNISALGGNDSITTKDVTQAGTVFADTADCGAGTDAITADLTDQNHLTNCENADISPGREGRHVRFGRLLRAHKGGKVPVALRCPRKASVACNGSLRLTVGRKTAGRSGHYRIRRGHKATVSLKLTRSFAKKVPFAGFMVAAEKGRFGKKTTRLRVGVN